MKQKGCRSYLVDAFEGKRQEKDGGPLYDLLKMVKLGALTREESAREERRKTSFTCYLACPKRLKRSFI